MRIVYEPNESVVTIREQQGQNGKDVELELQFLGEHPDTEGIRQIQHDFENNRVITDASFYAYHNHLYRIIVRNDYYTDLILALMKHRLVKKAEWV